MRAVYVIPKTHAELNQCVSLLRSTNFQAGAGDRCGQVGKRVTVWLNIKVYRLYTHNVFPHTQVTPNQLAGLLQEL
uniref:Putative DnaG-like primase n=1 Tax=Acinetobacter phage AJO2 TaxID=2315465 RepID=A0A3B8E6C4_9CAUD|nr:putative DnaG-like primase [Acinetobacter phage AJO2]